MKLRESVSIPTNRLSKPTFESAFSCQSMPSFWSRNHHRCQTATCRNRAVLEIADHGSDNVIVGGIEVIQDHLGQFSSRFQPIQVAHQRFDLRPVADRVVPGVGAKLRQAAAIRVTQRAQMQMLGPPCVGIQFAKEAQHEAAKLQDLRLTGRLWGSGAENFQRERALPWVNKGDR